jgi:amino acid adenylation domain-containing protein
MREQDAPGQSSALREAIAEIWRAELGVGEVADTDNFFHHGGHSALAVETALLLRSLTAIELALDILYEYPEFGLLVAAIDALLSGPPRGDVRELTRAEERLWFAEQLHRSTPAYHIGVLYRFSGTVDGERLVAAFAALVARHEALRRGFQAPGQAFVVSGALLASEAPALARRVHTGGWSQAAVTELLDREVQQPFELDRPPLARALVVERGEAGSLLLLTVHHLVCDMESVALLEAELQRLYAGAASPGSRSAATARAVPSRPQGSQALEYWRRALAGLPAGISLPYDRPRPQVLGVRGGRHHVEFAPETVAALDAIAAQERLSRFMTWVAAYAAGLAAVTGDRDLVVLVPFSARGPDQGQEVGMFADTLPLRVVLPPRASARSLVRLVRGVVTQALAHREVPIQVIVQEMRLGTDLSRAPLAQACLSFVDDSEWSWELADLHATREFYPTGTAKYELLWSVTLRPDGTTAADLEFNAGLFSAAAAGRLHEQLAAAIATAFAQPDAAVPAPAVAPAAGGESARGYESIAEVVHRQACERPDALAVVHGDAALTYRELDGWAAAIARGLVELGVRRGDIVAVPASRSAEAVASYLAVLRAGCAYLPLDMSENASRVRLIVQRTAARAAVVSGDSAAELVQDVLPVLRLDSLPAPEDLAGPPRRLTALDPAYVMFTSGSTATPKCVVVPHGAISRLVPNADYLSIEPQDRVAHASNPAFDAATFEIWGALTSGATLVVADRETILSAARLRSFLAAERISVIFLTTALFNQVVDFAPDAFQHLRAVLFGGEMHDARRLEKLLAGSPPGRLIHMYGPTENTTFSTWHELTLVDLASGVVPIGAPVTGSTAYVLDADGTAADPGAVGELHVGGSGLASGYYGAPSMTAAAFVPDPFGPRRGGRLYRTGDLVRQLPDGALCFVGRNDDQVKIRGRRVELVDIESAVRRQEGVADVAVLSRRTADGTEIVACVTVRGSVTEAELTGRLRAELPDYMVPAVVLLPHLPVTPNGKIDRAALAKAGGQKSQPAPQPAESAPRPGLALLAGVTVLWCEVLGIENIAADADFLALGGQSIKAMRLLARIDQEFGVQLELGAFFEHRTPRGAAALIRAAIERAPLRSGDG